MRKIIHKTSLHIVGYLAIAIGLAGLILPVIPGLPLLIIGFFFLSRASEKVYIKIETLKLKYPRLGRHYDIVDSKVNRFVKRAF